MTDGPFVETKEVVGGFAILEAASKEEAIELARTFLGIAGDGECEIRQIFTPSDAAPLHDRAPRAAHRAVRRLGAP